MASRKRTTDQRERDLAIVGEMHNTGYSLDRIAAHLKEQYGYDLSHASLYNDLLECRRRWKEEQIKEQDEKVAFQLARIDALERQAWDAFRQSQKDAETIHIVKRLVPPKKGSRAKPKLVIVEETHDVRGQAGDARFLQVIHDCHKHRARIMGIDTIKVAPVNPDGTEPFRFPPTEVPKLLEFVFRHVLGNITDQVLGNLLSTQNPHANVVNLDAEVFDEETGQWIPKDNHEGNGEKPPHQNGDGL